MSITRILKKVCIHSLFIASLLPLLCTSVQAAEIVSVKKDNINVRTGPGKDNPVFMELFRGYPLKVLSKKGEWLKITDYENDKGWIHSSLIEKGNTVIVNAKNKVNLRSGPTTKSAVVASIERGVVLTKLSSKGNWLKIRHSGGTEGWIYQPLVWP